MKKEEIHFWDIKRWLFGQAPPEFMIEVFIRTILIYLFLLLIFEKPENLAALNGTAICDNAVRMIGQKPSWRNRIRTLR